MTLTEKRVRLADEVEALRKGPGRKYSKAMRERVLARLARAQESGVRDQQTQSRSPSPAPAADGVVEGHLRF